MIYKVITTFKPGNWDRYAKRMIQSVLDRWIGADVTVYYQVRSLQILNMT